MELVIVSKLGRSELCDFVICNGYIINLKHEHYIHDALTQNFSLILDQT
jgi:hypothetical protein